jgi:hypothetical protein
VRLTSEPVWVDGAETATTTLYATISNLGNISASLPLTVSFYAGHSPTGTLINTALITTPMAGCGTARVVTATWSSLSAGAYPIYARVQGSGTMTETDPGNNLVTGQVLIASHRNFLPLVRRTLP